ncbi:ribosomal RNA processing 47 isoform X1 [Rhipicephalus microplus]|uniref:ribosomal RNA processing 47 isoform X1 n=1 Tax=Rhipicephalus microplus TaxID=6941 RepID=UPI003F6AD9CB
MAASKPVVIAPCREFPDEIKEQSRAFHSALLNVKETLSPILAASQEVATEEQCNTISHPHQHGKGHRTLHHGSSSQAHTFHSKQADGAVSPTLHHFSRLADLGITHKMVPIILAGQLSPLDKARLDLTLLYSLNSLFWMYLCTLGEDPKQHSVRQELDRVKEYMTRAKQIADKAKAPKLVAGAAQRFVRNALWTATDGGQKDDQEPPRKKRR